MFRPSHRFSSVTFAVLFLMLVLTLMVISHVSAIHSNEPVVNKWGIKEIRPTRQGGATWYAHWSSRDADSWVRWIKTGGVHVAHPSRSTMMVGGNSVRMYVRHPHPDKQEQWTGALEVTVYGRRIPGADRGKPYSGIVTDVRTNHGSVDGSLYQHPCDSRGLLARLRFDGTADFGKEVRHPNTVARHAVRVWKGGMPVGVWIGYKHIVYDTSNSVVQQLWVDFPGGGQHWVKVNQIVDRGGSWGAGERPCRPGIDPSMPLRGGTSRVGSESGLPNVAVLFRSDLSRKGYLEYRHASVREVR